MTNQWPALGFSAQREHYLGEKLSLRYQNAWPAYHRWLSRAPKQVSAELGRKKLQQYMPELINTYDSLCQILGGSERTGSFLSLYNPPVFRAGCSQAVKVNENTELVRNYDFPEALSDRLLLHTQWNGTRVIAMTDCLWGVLDGMNEHGLAVSLAYGGRSNSSDGFAITLVLRYLLEFCHNVVEAVEVLKKVPVHMAYNVTLVDREGTSKTAIICPGQPLKITTLGFATNHQNDAPIENLNAIADSYLREQFLSARLADKAINQQSLVELFLQEPLLRKSSDWRGWGTLYTAKYLPMTNEIELHWPHGQVIEQSFDHFVELDFCIHSPAFS